MFTLTLASGPLLNCGSEAGLSSLLIATGALSVESVSSLPARSVTVTETLYRPSASELVSKDSKRFASKLLMTPSSTYSDSSTVMFATAPDSFVSETVTSSVLSSV